MAVMRIDLFSDVLGMSTSVTVILPQETQRQIGMAGSAAGADGLPVLYLLHGLSDDDTIWTRRTSIERYVADRGLAVVMPQGARSFYADEEFGFAYWTYLTEELPALMHTFFHLSDRREDTFVAGLSMGGYGAMKWALRQPERFAAAASLSGALAAATTAHLPDHDLRADMVRVFGGADITGTHHDVLHLIDAADVDALPALYVCCGTEDYLLQGSTDFIARAEARGVDVTVDLGPGEHEWGYWDARIQDILDWLPLRH